MSPQGARPHAKSRNSTRARTAAATAEASRRQLLRTIKAKGRFLRVFARCGNVLRSAMAAAVGRRSVYEWLRDDPNFKRLYDEALGDALDELEGEAWRRAHDGVLKPVYQQGRKVGSVREYSDALMALLLKGNKPDKFRERFEHTGKDGKPIQTEVRTVKFGGRYKPKPESN